jgi:hypothetical protein
VFINTQYLWAKLAVFLRILLVDTGLIPALNGSAADIMGSRQFALRDTFVVSFKHFGHKGI